MQPRVIYLFCVPERASGLLSPLPEYFFLQESVQHADGDGHGHCQNEPDHQLQGDGLYPEVQHQGIDHEDEGRVDEIDEI